MSIRTNIATDSHGKVATDSHPKVATNLRGCQHVQLLRAEPDRRLPPQSGRSGFLRAAVQLLPSDKHQPAGGRPFGWRGLVPLAARP